MSRKVQIAESSDVARLTKTSKPDFFECTPGGLLSNATCIKALTRTAPKASGDNGGLIIVGVIVLILALAKCSSSPSNLSTPATVADNLENAQTALVKAVEAQGPSAPEPLSRSNVRRGISRVAMASKESLGGEMIFSQNCYDAVARTFSWKKLDECGGFDVEASLVLGDGEPVGAEKEVAWFDAEAAAGRYLKAAVAAGLDADAADVRLASLQSQVNKKRRLKPQIIPEEADPFSNIYERRDPAEDKGNDALDV